MRVCSASRPPEPPARHHLPRLRPELLGAALLILALATAQAAGARAYAPDDRKARATPYAAAVEALLGETPLGETLLGEIRLGEPLPDEAEIHLAMLEIGPMLYGLALEEAEAPPPWRGNVTKSAALLALFVLLVAGSTASTERRAQARRHAWRRRAEAIYDRRPPAIPQPRPGLRRSRATWFAKRRAGA